jgi:Fe-Mn family superoxide dismutase
MKKSIEELIGSLDIKSIVKTSVKGAKSDLLGEAYVAEPKQYKQVSELTSERTKKLHTELYKQYVETFNRVSAELDGVNKDETNSRHSTFRLLKLDETYNLNAVQLHELYFANAFDPHSECYVDSLPYMKLSSTFGTFDDWQTDFIACALSAGNGWAVCGYNFFLKSYINTIISNMSQDVMVGFMPLIVLDMYEHANIIDYSTDKKSAAIAFMRSINWNVIEERFNKSEKIARLL